MMAQAAMASATKASATAWGCTFGNAMFGPPQYCVYLSGGGNWVNSVTGNFGGGTPIQNWYITAEFFDLSWHWYQTINSRYHSGCCWGGGGDVVYVNGWKYTGYMCSTLHYQASVYGVIRNRTMSVCHQIHP
jgi:hypothetical protein